jgi:aspartyl protease family protein
MPCAALQSATVLTSLVQAALLACALAAPAAFADEPDIEVVGLSEGRAVIVGRNGKPKVYREGDVLPNGARLIQATRESAVIESGGKRRTVVMGTNMSAAPRSDGSGRAVLTADAHGHFETMGTINGGSVRFLVDTGATLISMGVNDARRIGIDYTKGERALSSTANGVARVYRVRLDTVKVGDITLNNVEGSVHEGSMPFVLLGMSFLNRVEMNRQGDALTLVKRF